LFSIFGEELLMINYQQGLIRQSDNKNNSFESQRDTIRL